MWFTSAKRPDQLLLPDTIYFPSEEKPVLGQGKVEGKEEKDWAAGEQELGRRTLQRCSSESVLKGTNAVEIQRGHERMCIRRAEVVKQRGISLLNEVDAQNSALQVMSLTPFSCVIGFLHKKANYNDIKY